jgi:hypothetical protein
MKTQVRISVVNRVGTAACWLSSANPQFMAPIVWRESLASSEGELPTILIVLSTQIGH